MSQPKPQRLGYFFAALLALLAGIYLFHLRQRGDTNLLHVEKDAIPRFFALRLADSHGQSIEMAYWQGKTLVINFWATWCPPCREEMPEFSRINREFSAKNVQFIGISLDTSENVRVFERKTPVSYPLLIAETQGGEIARSLGNSRLALPYTIVIDPHGNPVFSHLGKVDSTRLEKLLREIR